MRIIEPSKGAVETPVLVPATESTMSELEETQSPSPEHEEPELLAALGGNPGAQLLHLRKHLEFQKQEKFQKLKISRTTIIDQAQSRRHITTHLHAKINLKATTATGQDFYQPGKANTEEALQNMDRMTFMVRSKGRIEAGMGFDRHLSWNTRYRIFRQRYPGLSDELFWETMKEDRNRAVAPKILGFPLDIQVEMMERERARRDLKEYNKRLRELISTQGGNPDEYKKAVIRVMRYCYSCSQIHPDDPEANREDPYSYHLHPHQTCPDCGNQLGPKREFASPAGEWPKVASVKELLRAPRV